VIFLAIKRLVCITDMPLYSQSIMYCSSSEISFVGGCSATSVGWRRCHGRPFLRRCENQPDRGQTPIQSKTEKIWNTPKRLNQSPINSAELLKDPPVRNSGWFPLPPDYFGPFGFDKWYILIAKDWMHGNFFMQQSPLYMCAMIFACYP
jgi:hypothetical protein